MVHGLAVIGTRYHPEQDTTMTIFVAANSGHLPVEETVVAPNLLRAEPRPPSGTSAAAGDHLGSELLDIVSCPQVGNGLVEWALGGGNELSEFLLVVLVTGRGYEEDHASRPRPRVGECVGTPAGNVHDAAGNPVGDSAAGERFPVLPVGGRSNARFEGKKIELALEDVEQLFCVPVKVRPYVEPRLDVDDFEQGPDFGLGVAYLDGHGRRDSFTLAG